MKVMDMFEEVGLKGQKLKMSSLVSKPEFKQFYLAPIRSLDQLDQEKVLSKLIDGELSLPELRSECQRLKNMYALKAAFARLTNSGSWETAELKFPVYANEEQLTKFLACDLFTKDIC